jgi:GH25 family lysozyme M1 (1,4-beta-N-acetylmuramidase)
MATLRDDYAFVMDVSKYQPRIDWQEMAEYVKAVAIRSSFGAIGYGGYTDPKLALHNQGAYDVNIPTILYHALDPGYYVNKLQSLEKLKNVDQYLPADKDEQWQTFLQALEHKSFYALTVDHEITLDWNRQVIPIGWQTEIAKMWMTRMLKRFPNVPRIYYTGSWFVWGFAKDIETTGVLKNICDLWSAYYPYADGVVNLKHWEDIKANYPPDTMSIQFPTEPMPRQTQNPPYLGWDTWKFWQYSGDKFTLPFITDEVGNPSALDLNLFNGTTAKLYEYLKFTPATVTPTPEPTPEPEPEPEPVPITEIEALRTRVDDLDAELTALKAGLRNAAK